jgi:hypothetical protein
VILWAFTELFQKETADCKITRYCMARLIGFAWSKVVSVGDNVSVF